MLSARCTNQLYLGQKNSTFDYLDNLGGSRAVYQGLLPKSRAQISARYSSLSTRQHSSCLVNFSETLPQLHHQ